MTTPTSDTMLEKVRKLLAKAEDPGCTPEEAAALNDKAAELIAKYGVDQALLAASGHAQDDVDNRHVIVVAPFALDKAALLGMIATQLRCQSVRGKQWMDGGFVYDMHLFGFGVDLERVELLFTSLLVQASYGLAAQQPPRGEPPAAYRRSWMAGFTQAVGNRLRAAESRAAREAAPSSGPSTDLVLVDRTKQVGRAVEVAYPRLGTAGPRRLRGSGASAGYAAGQRADLGGTRLGRGTRGALAR